MFRGVWCHAFFSLLHAVLSTWLQGSFYVPSVDESAEAQDSLSAKIKEKLTLLMEASEGRRRLHMPDPRRQSYTFCKTKSTHTHKVTLGTMAELSGSQPRPKNRMQMPMEVLLGKGTATVIRQHTHQVIGHKRGATRQIPKNSS